MKSGYSPYADRTKDIKGRRISSTGHAWKGYDRKRWDDCVRCISVYTNSFDVFSDVYEVIRQMALKEDEEKVIDGVVVQESGTVPEHYLNKMRTRRNVAIMIVDEVMILQRDDLFEILLPDDERESYVM